MYVLRREEEGWLCRAGTWSSLDARLLESQLVVQANPISTPHKIERATLFPVQGVSTLAGGDGSRQPSELELDYAEHQVCGFRAFLWENEGADCHLTVRKGQRPPSAIAHPPIIFHRAST